MIARVETAKECWDKLKVDFQSSGLVEKHDLWVDFVECTYKGEEIGAFCIWYREVVNRCIAAFIKIEEMIQVMQFLHVVDSHFDQWTTIKRAEMRQGIDLPSLDSLLHEIKDKYRHKKEQAGLHVQSITSSVVQNTQASDGSFVRCSHYGLPRYIEVRCYYKHVNFRRLGWQPDTLILQRIQERSRSKNANHVQTIGVRCLE